MSNNAILIQNLSIEEFEKLVDNSLSKKLAEITKSLSKNNDDDVLLTRDETCKFLKIDSSTLWSWTNKGKVKAYGIGSRRYYKKSELLDSMQLLSKNK